MKKVLVLVFSLVWVTATYAQKVIKNPKVGAKTTTAIDLLNITLLDTATVIDCKVNYKPGWWVSIPSQTYIKADNSGDELYVRSVSSYKLDEKITIPESGVITYQMVFPPIKPDTEIIDFVEGNGGTWNIFDVELIPQEKSSNISDAIAGNWFLADGSNAWYVGLYDDLIIYENNFWSFEKVIEKKKVFTFKLSNDQEEHFLMVKLDKDGSLWVGPDKQKLVKCRRTPVENADFILTNDESYSSQDFKVDTAVYAGYLKGYSAKMGEQTGVVYVNNIITGHQESHLLKINDNGTFQLNIPLYYPHWVFVRFPFFNGAVFLEPGKKATQFIDLATSSSKSRKLHYMGELALLNTNLELVLANNKFNHQKVGKEIGDMTPEQYKIYCNKIDQKERQAWNDLLDSVVVCEKAKQFAEFEFQYRLARRLLDYRYLRRNAAKKDTSIQDVKLEQSYFDFIKELPFNNSNSVINTSYGSFINAFKFSDILVDRSLYGKNAMQFEDELKALGVEFSSEENAMLEAFKEMDQSAYSEQMKAVDSQYRKLQYLFLRKYRSDMGKDNGGVLVYSDWAAKIEGAGKKMTQQEQEMVAAYAAIQTEENLKPVLAFNAQYGEVMKAFGLKYQDAVRKVYARKMIEGRNQRMKDLFNVEEGILIDIMNAQDICPSLDKYNTLTEPELARLPQLITTPPIVEYIHSQNQAVIDQIERNKSKTGYTVNEVPKTKGEKLFDEIIKPYHGKVVYVDFWATWCGPCRNAMKRISPLKEEMKEDEVVFVYITNPSSPKETWENMIANVKGEHYRVSQDEWNVLSSQFQISGIPHITLVGKDGSIINPHLSHGMSNDAIKSLLQKHVSED